MTKPKSASRALPEKPNLEHLKNQARALRKQVQAGEHAALERVRAHHPRLADAGKLDVARFSLSDAQLVIAREYGFPSYPKLKTHVERRAAEAARASMPAATSFIPVIALRSRPLFPDKRAVLTLRSPGRSLSAAQAALAAGSLVLCVTRRDPDGPDVEAPELHAVGLVARIELLKPAPDGSVKALLHCTARARLTELIASDGYEQARIELLPALTGPSTDATRLTQELYARLEPIARRTDWLSLSELARRRDGEHVRALTEIALQQCDPAAHQALLELPDPQEFFERLCLTLDTLASSPHPRPMGSACEAADRGGPPEDACLVVLYADGYPHLLGRRFALRERETKCGRGLDNHFALHSDSVSRVHALIERQGEDFVLVDQRSTNGTFVNELPEPVDRYSLADGDRFALGGVVLQFLRGGGLEAKYRAAVDYIHEHDGLTDLLNRDHWLSRLEHEVLLARASERPLCVLMMALDQSEELNRNLGQLAVNGLLRQVARLLEQTLDTSAVIGRYAAAGFGVVLPGCEVARARDLAERLRAAVAARPLVVAGNEAQVTLSVGAAALYRATGRDEVVDDALALLARAKLAGGNRVQGPEEVAA